MKSVAFHGNQNVSIVDVPVPEPGPGEVRVRTGMSAICGSEMGVFRGKGLATGNPGHEAMGTVDAVGEGVTRVSVGDRVGASAICGCGAPSCTACQNGQSTWCPQKEFYGNMHAEYFLIAETGCLPLDSDIPDDVAVLVSGDGLGVPYHTSLKLRGEDIQRVVVFGLGPIGLGNVLVQAYLGRAVIAVDLVRERLDYARTLGAAHVVNANTDDVPSAISRLTDGRGADAAIEAAGVARTAKQCFKVVRTNGLVVFNGEQPAVKLSPSEDFIRRDIRAVGSWFYQVGEFPAMVELVRQGLKVKNLISHVLTLDQAPEAYDAFVSGKAAKVLLDMHSPPRSG